VVAAAREFSKVSAASEYLSSTRRDATQILQQHRAAV
jgi:hypothetical protein